MKNRRSVNVADAKLIEIRQHGISLGETEFRRKLQPVGRGGNFHGIAGVAASRRRDRESSAGIAVLFLAFSAPRQAQHGERAVLELVDLATAHEPFLAFNAGRISIENNFPADLAPVRRQGKRDGFVMRIEKNEQSIVDDAIAALVEFFDGIARQPQAEAAVTPNYSNPRRSFPCRRDETRRDL